MGRLSESQWTEADRSHYSRRNYATGGAGFKAEGTSQKAAEQVNAKLGAKQAAVLKSLSAFDFGATADQIAGAMGLHVTQVRPRLTELVKKGLIERTDETRPSAMGKASNVFVVCGK